MKSFLPRFFSKKRAAGGIIEMIYRIGSRSNQRVKDLIKKRDEYFFFEGEKLVNDILERGDEIAILIVNENKETQLNIPAGAAVNDTWVVSQTVLDKISSLKKKPDFIAVLEPREKPVDFRKSRVIIGLDSIQDPANAGTVFRCAAAFGIDAVALSGAGVNLTNSKFLRAAQDAIFDMNYQRFHDVEALIEAAAQANAALKVYLTSSHFEGKGLAPHEIEFPCLILFGNEGKGLEEGLFKKYPFIRVPQAGKVESLNVGVSACIIMYEISNPKKILDNTFVAKKKK
jgi:TrmH family RNA methyltransferase